MVILNLFTMNDYPLLSTLFCSPKNNQLSSESLFLMKLIILANKFSFKNVWPNIKMSPELDETYLKKIKFLRKEKSTYTYLAQFLGQSGPQFRTGNQNLVA